MIVNTIGLEEQKREHKYKKQCGYLLFADSRAEQIRISIGVVPFSAGNITESLTEVYYEKDITGYWSIRQNIKRNASAYEFLKTGGVISEGSVGSGHLIAVET